MGERSEEHEATGERGGERQETGRAAAQGRASHGGAPFGRPLVDEKRLGEVVLHAAGLGGGERDAYLDDVSASDPALAGEARARLAAAESVTTFLERPAAARLDAAGELGGASAAADPTPASSTALRPAERYRLGECLGRGGMGRVVAANDRQLERRVALKFLTSDDPARRRLFLREGRAQARIRHEHVLEVYDGGELEGQPFLSMRYVAGGTLDDVAPRLSLEHKIRLLIQVAEGLHAAHRLGLLHRDVKPANVLVEETADGDLRALVGDFGIAADVAEAGAPAGGAIAGTPQYMAPECLTGGDAVDRRADVYSLGITAYKVLTGTLPYEGPLTVDVLRQTVDAELPPPRRKRADLPAEIEAIILRATAKDPNERYASARAVAEDLRRYLDGEVVEAYAAGLAYRLTRFALRHRPLVAMAALALLALAVASIAVAVFAFRADAARHRAELRRGQAEDLIRFMVVDLQKKLEATSRLAVLDDVAEAATRYFAAVPEEELSEEELLRRSRMLYQLGNLRIQQGDLTGAASPMAESLGSPAVSTVSPPATRSASSSSARASSGSASSPGSGATWKRRGGRWRSTSKSPANWSRSMAGTSTGSSSSPTPTATWAPCSRRRASSRRRWRSFRARWRSRKSWWRRRPTTAPGAPSWRRGTTRWRWCFATSAD